MIENQSAVFDNGNRQCGLFVPTLLFYASRCISSSETTEQSPLISGPTEMKPSFKLEFYIPTFKKQLGSRKELYRKFCFYMNLEVGQ